MTEHPEVPFERLIDIFLAGYASGWASASEVATSPLLDTQEQRDFVDSAGRQSAFVLRQSPEGMLQVKAMIVSVLHGEITFAGGSDDQ